MADDTFMSELHLKYPIIGTYSACRPFTKDKEKKRKIFRDR